MPVSTDGVMLGAWANISSAMTILDIGTGTGLLALMCAQRNLHSRITAIDVESTAIETAIYNTTQSKWKERIQVIKTNILSYHPEISFDHIICNPPYFNDGEKSQNTQRAIARHSHSLPHLSLINQCKTLLKPSGRASFILPSTEGETFIRLAQNEEWFVSRRCDVKTTENKEVKRVMFELSLYATQSIQTKIVIHDKTHKLGYSEDFIKLCQPFYLKM
ncbi:methyltransferase [Shewanella sp. Arc9-LZ]|nr:methyltransferase [Shewanella sp. Arc9-LZ]